VVLDDAKLTVRLPELEADLDGGQRSWADAEQAIMTTSQRACACVVVGRIYLPDIVRVRDPA
jgi:N-acetylglutamate synthase/N-acetylornithine aminotransferase